MRRSIPLCVLLLAASPAAAQVVRDGSIGPAAPLAVGSGSDPNGDFADYLITEDLGELRGSNLFHSFETFSVGPGEVATYTGSAGIDFVLTRTTGSAGSFLFGTLRSTIPGAEIFFASPGGLVIGEGAQLDVPGSIHFSTATALRFEDAAFDLPTDSLARPALLSSAPPSAWGFGPDPAPISIGAVDASDQSKTLSVPPGETLSIVGGDVTLTGFPATSPFFYQGDVIGAPGANVEIASSAGDEDIPLSRVDGRTRLDLAQLPPDALGGTVEMIQNARIDVGAPSGSDLAGGSVVVRAGSFRIVDGRIEATTRSDVSDAGAIDIGARDEIVLDAARITTATAAGGRGGAVRMEAGTLWIGGDSVLRTISTAAGDAGDFGFEAAAISVVEGAEISSINTGTGAGGAISMRATTPQGDGTLSIVGEGIDASGFRRSTTLFSNPRGEGAGGVISLEADAVSISDSGEVLSIARGGASGVGGAIEIRTADLVVEDGSFVSTSTEGAAAGGAVLVEGLGGGLAGRVVVANSGDEPEPARISTNTLSADPSAGPGGDLTLRAERVDLLTGGQVFARTEGGGAAGRLAVEADSVLVSGVLANPESETDPFRSGITSRVGDDGAAGTGSGLSIDTRVLEIANGGQISTATFGIGDAADLRITSSERVTVRGGVDGASRISAASVAGPGAPGGGEGGLIEIDTGLLELRDGGQITASTTGAGDPGEVGDAGDVIVRADRVEISGAAGFDVSGVFSKSNSAATQGVGDGGDVSLVVAGDLNLSDGGLIEVSSSGDGNAGNIALAVGGALRLDDASQIRGTSADASGGSSGAIFIDAAGDVVLRGASEISASTGVQSTGAGGIVRVRSGSDLRLSGGSRISSSSDGFGDAGAIEISAQRVFASDGSAISTEAGAASGGSILVNAGSRFELVDASVTTSVQGRAGVSDAGDVGIFTPGLVLVNRGSVVAQAIGGEGGRIEIRSGGSFISGDSLISASSREGPQGEIELTPPENGLISELASLPAALVDPSQLLYGACEVRTERDGSFTVRTTPDVAPPPDAGLSTLRTSPSGPACE